MNIYIYIIIYMNHHCHVIVIYIEATFSLAQIQFLSAVLVHPQTIWLKIPKHVSLKTEFNRNEHIMSPPAVAFCFLSKACTAKFLLKLRALRPLRPRPNILRVSDRS